MTTKSVKSRLAGERGGARDVSPVWTLRDWVPLVAGLDGGGVLPERAVIVHDADCATCLRRLLVDSGQGEALIGTRLVTPLQAAVEVLARAGELRRASEERTRPARLLALMRRRLGLNYFDEALMRSTPGWEYAFPRTIAELEAVGLSPDQLERLGDDPRLHDLAVVWRALERGAQGLSVAGALALAAERLAERPALWGCAGESFATVAPETSPIVAGLLRAIPRLRLGVQVSRPKTAERRGALATLVGSAAAAVWWDATRAFDATCERGLLGTYLLADPGDSLAPRRPRSAGPDGTVTLEDVAGVEEEVAAAARWVAAQVRRGTPLGDIAVVSPTPDPYVALLAARIGALPGAPGVYVAGGVPFAGSTTGARALAVLRALRGWLAVDLVATVLPALRPPAGVAPVALSGSAGRELAYGLGTVGGSDADRDGALAWPARLAARAVALQAEIAAAEAEDLDPDQLRGGRAAWAAKRLLAKVEAVTPGVEALTEIAAQMKRGEAAEALAASLSRFLHTWLAVPDEEREALPLVDEVIVSASAAPPREALEPTAFLQLVEEALLGLRLRRGRYGDAAVYVGPLARAAELAFTAVRVVGLSEGSVPQAPRDNPLFPEPLRAVAARKSERAAQLLSAEARAQRAMAALVRVVWAAGDEVAWSAPRSDADRTAKEPSSLFIDAAMAIGRGLGRAAAGGARRVPSATDLEALYFAPARAARRAAVATAPLGEADWLDRAAAGERGVPPGWLDAAAENRGTALPRLTALRAAPDRRALLGRLSPATPAPALPGLAKTHGISASRLEALLGCPRYFLFTTVLGWGEPAEVPEVRRIGQPMYGSLLHAVHETFFAAHGAAFGARERTLAHWQALAAAEATRTLEAFLCHYPLVGAAVVEQERRRLLGDVEALLAYDWHDGAPRRFVAVEREFGFDEALGLDLPGGRLYVRGRIDRLDEEDGVTWVRDLKSGKAHPRRGDEAGPTLGVDTQLGLYALVAKKLAKVWRVPATVVGAYVYPVTPHDPERAFVADYARLEGATKGWLTAARALLEARGFVPSPDPGACEYCAFAPVCGEEAPRRSAALLAAEPAGSPLAAYLALFAGAADDADQEADQ